MPDDLEIEPATGIRFPRKLNSFIYAGAGVRIKLGFIKVYAVATYVEQNMAATDALKHASPNDINKALLNPEYARTIRIVMNRAVGIDLFNSSIIDALTPRMNGRDTEQLDKFKELGPKQDLEEGDVIDLLIRGDTMYYKNSLGGAGVIQSIIFTRAVCDVYYGDDSASPTHKEAVIRGIASLK